jgi:hypothetical protein
MQTPATPDRSLVMSEASMGVPILVAKMSPGSFQRFLAVAVSSVW